MHEDATHGAELAQRCKHHHRHVEVASEIVVALRIYAVKLSVGTGRLEHLVILEGPAVIFDSF